MKKIYLDNSATTALCPPAIERLKELSESCFGNPSSLYGLGQEALEIIEQARSTFAQSLHVSKEEVFFTSCGSESNNTAIIGSALALKRRGNKIITSAGEHHSVLETFKFLEKLGFETVIIPLEKNGTVNIEEFKRQVDSQTVLASFMMVNNETGAVNPIKDLADIFHKASPLGNFHCDCVQSYAKTDIHPQKTGIDILSVSGHKIHAPKGIGGIYIKKGTKILPLIYGGGQEKGMRSGTEAVPQIGAFEAAIKFSFENLSKKEETVRGFNTYIRERLLKTEGIKMNSPVQGSPYIINISVLGIPSEVMIRFLEGKNILVSGGSACAKGHKSHVLTAMGLESREINSAVRISFCGENNFDEIVALCEGIEAACKELVRKI